MCRDFRLVIPLFVVRIFLTFKKLSVLDGK